jgi:lipid-A-disaccharide synthase-like uncharacterized protein
MHTNALGILAVPPVLGMDGETFWTAVGWLANAIFSSRFLVQWYATEQRKEVTVPVLFWWLSLAGSLMFLGYAINYDRQNVFIFAYAFNWIPYLRNLVIYYRYRSTQKLCLQCGKKGGPKAHFCEECGTRLAELETP